MIVKSFMIQLRLDTFPLSKLCFQYLIFGFGNPRSRRYFLAPFAIIYVTLHGYPVSIPSSFIGYRNDTQLDPELTAILTTIE